MKDIFRRLNRLNEREQALSPSDRLAYDAYREQADKWAGNPSGYVEAVMGGLPTQQQRAIWNAALTWPYQVLVPSANNVGKTRALAWWANWFYDNHRPSISILTAPTQTAVRDLAFREIRLTRKNSYGFAPKDTRLQDGWDHFLHGFTASNPDAFHGRHERYLNLMYDEATGIKQPFIDRGKTMFGRHEGHYWICTYNPNEISSPMYAEEESGLWNIVRLNALEHENIAYQLAGYDPPYPSAIRLETILGRLQSDCEPVNDDNVDVVTDFQFPNPSHSYKNLSFHVGNLGLRLGQWWRPISAAFEPQILGRWSIIGSDNLFSPALIAKCRDTVIGRNDEWKFHIGCDVARFGSDETCFVYRQGPVILGIECYSQRDTNWIADRAWEIAAMLEPDVYRRQEIRFNIDTTGGYGGGVADKLNGKLDVNEVCFSSESPNPKILRMRSYLWFSAYEIVYKQAVDLSRILRQEYQRLVADLVAPRYRIDEFNRKVLEPKKVTKERTKKSPDIGDAFCLCLYTD